MGRLTLIIGNRNYSSWSLRAWLALEATGLDGSVVVVDPICAAVYLRRADVRKALETADAQAGLLQGGEDLRLRGGTHDVVTHLPRGSARNKSSGPSR